LCLHEPSIIGIPLESNKQLTNLKIDNSSFHSIAPASKKPFIIDDIIQDSSLLSLFEPFIISLNIVSTVGLPLINGDRGIGEIILGSTFLGALNQVDLVTLQTAANQLANAIERSRFASQTDEGLRKANQLTAVTQISHNSIRP
jgi:GAF domain-containing protein